MTQDEAGNNPRWARFANLYYILNTVMVLSYGVMRYYFMSSPSPRLTTKETWTGFSQEVEVLGLAAAMLLSKFRKIATFDELLERVLFVGKATVSVLLCFVGVLPMVCYLVMWAGLSLVVQRPRFTLPPEVSRLTGGEFQSMVRSSTQAPGPPVAWLVMFHADWCSASVNIQPMFGALARRFSGKNRRFAHVDVVAFPEVAENLNINTGGTSKQIPTLALFLGGREVCRLPTFASDGRVVPARLDERGVVKYFELEKDFKTASYGRKTRARG